MNVYVFQHTPKGIKEVRVIDTEVESYFSTTDLLLDYPEWKLSGVSFVAGLAHVYLSKKER